MKTAILGGGLSGLLVSYLIRKQNVTIFEKESECGGLCKSKSENGFTFDIGGSHIIFSLDKDVLNSMLFFLEDNIVKNKRNTKIFYKGILVKYPFENGLGDLPKTDCLECLEGYINATIFRKTNPDYRPQNYLEWLRWKFGEGITNQYLLPYNQKLWKFPLKDMDNFWVIDRIPDPKIGDLLKAAIGLDSEGYTHQAEFFYPHKGGIQSLIDSIREKTTANIRLDQNLEKVTFLDNKWIVTSNGETESFDKIISTIPIPELIELLNEVPIEIKKAANELKTISLINVFFGIEGSVAKQFQNLTWLYVPQKNDAPSHRISFYSNYSPNNAPDDKMGINLEITTNFESDIWQMTNENLLEILKEQLVSMNIIQEDQVIYSDIAKWRRAYVLYDLAYNKNINLVKKFLTNKNIISFGRFGTYEYLNMDHIFKKAKELVYNHNLE